MRLVDSICVMVAELVHNLGYPIVILRVKCIADEAFEFKGAAFALVVELIVKRFGDIWVHFEKVWRLPLHVAATGAS